MTWTSLYRTLGTQHKRLARPTHVANVFPPRVPIDRFCRIVWNLERLQQRPLERFIKTFAQDRRWPEMNIHQQYFLRHRLAFARTMIELMRARNYRTKRRTIPDAPLIESEPAMMEWLLIDLWEQRGTYWFRELLHQEYELAVRWRTDQLYQPSEDAFPS